jgi:hypothetical protein
MAQAGDTDTTIEYDNVRHFHGGKAKGSTRTGRSKQAGPRDPTAALRSKRYREGRKQGGERDGGGATNEQNRDGKPASGEGAPKSEKSNEIKPGVTVKDAPPLAPDTYEQEAGKRHGRGITFATLTAALALATISGGFSITGMTSIFVGAYWPVIGMGVALEVGKLAAVAWLGHQQSTGSWGLKVALGALVAVLMGLNAVGCYGFLAKAHIGHQVDGDVAVAGRAADVDGRIAVQEGVVSDLDHRIAQIDKAIETATQRGRAAAAMQLAADQRRNRADLATHRDQANKTLASLKVEKARIEGQQKVADADLGPVRYLASLLGADDQDVLKRFILVVACLLDPAAVLLLLAATRR